MARSTRRRTTTSAKPQQRGFGLNTLILLLIVIVFLVAVTFPLWRNILIALDPVNVAFSSLTEAEREKIRLLPQEQLDLLLSIAEQDNERATDMAFAIQQTVSANDNFHTGNLSPRRQGQFVTIDAVHRAGGSAAIYELGGNNRILRLENFTTPPAPLNRDPAANTPGGTLELHLMFSTETVFTVDGGLTGNTFDVGALKANTGNQNYTLPTNFNPANYKSLVIYSAKYGVVISYAVLN